MLVGMLGPWHEDSGGDGCCQVREICTHTHTLFTVYSRRYSRSCYAHIHKFVGTSIHAVY